MAFEEDLKKLEKIVEDLHAEKLPLEKAVEKFEEGVKLADACLKTLETMRQKIEVVAKTRDGKMKLKPLASEEEAPEE
jgi:exodeoxyribonuclease VII small subunit